MGKVEKLALDKIQPLEKARFLADKLCHAVQLTDDTSRHTLGDAIAEAKSWLITRSLAEDVFLRPYISGAETVFWDTYVIDQEELMGERKRPPKLPAKTQNTCSICGQVFPCVHGDFLGKSAVDTDPKP